LGSNLERDISQTKLKMEQKNFSNKITNCLMGGFGNKRGDA
jgi:hypothetical protein